MKTKLIDPIEGYKWSNYDKRYGINPSGDDIPSNLVIEQVENLILDGYSDSTIYCALTNVYKMNSYSAKFIVRKAHDTLLKKEEKQTENMLQKQNSRLFKLYRKALEKCDEKTALSILAEINKLNSLYTKRIEISSNVFTLDLGFDTKDIKNDNTEQEN